MPIGILGSLAVCTVLYVLFGHVLTGVANWQEFKTAGKEASVAYAIQKYMIGYEWLGTMVTVAILAGFSSVILVMLLGQSRVFYSMSKDGLLPRIFSDLHPKFRTPYKSNLLLFAFVGAFAAFIPGPWQATSPPSARCSPSARRLHRHLDHAPRRPGPDRPRPFRTPAVHVVATPVRAAVRPTPDAEPLIGDDLGSGSSSGWSLGLVVYFA